MKEEGGSMKVLGLCKIDWRCKLPSRLYSSMATCMYEQPPKKEVLFYIFEWNTVRY